ncbi:CHAT domain protein [Kordia sp. SMS9]|uniref:CHAT domain-containing protein n=1 Tax=Kordia sp. SMS9 TaxID=2282170 RepID=UPI000E0DF800|nr:CHAT domain-containing tetratricopeptide repeat protein [Kordia sp. SMS9]AXG71592.1 CHAT domain protein [Kordia sp. SMS9]
MSFQYKITRIQKIITFGVVIFCLQYTQAQTVQNDTILGKELLEKAITLADNEKYATSNKILAQAATHFQKVNNWNLWYDAYYEIFSNGLRSEKYKTCIVLMEQGLLQLPKNELLITAKIYSFLGFCNDQIGHNIKAIQQYERSLANFKKVQPPDLYRINRVQGNLAEIYTKEGDNGKALAYAKIAIHSAILAKDSMAIWKNTKILGNVYVQIEAFDMAQKTYKKAQQLRDDKDGTFELIEANILYKSGDYEAALQATLATIRLTKNCDKDSYCHYNLEEATELLGEIFMELDQPKKALLQFENYLKFIEPYENKRAIGQTYIRIGDVYAKLKQHDVALQTYQKALNTFIPEFKETDPSQNPLEDSVNLEIWLMEIFRNKGDCYFAKYKETDREDWLLKATENYELAVNMSETKRLNFSETSSKLTLGSYTNTFYEQYIKAKLALYKRTKDATQLQEAFKISQRANAFVLRELMNEKDALKIASVSKDSMDLFQEYEEKIANLSRKVEDSINLVTSQKQLFDTKENFKLLKKSIAKNYPKFDKLRNDLQGISATKIQQQLQDDELFIKYFLGESTLYTFSITNHRFQVDETLLPDEFQTILSQYKQAISDMLFINKTPDIAEQQYLQTAHALYKTLLQKPLQLARDHTITAITIVPDGALCTIPFQALLTEKSDSWSKLEHTVIKKYAIGYHYFCKMLFHSNGNDKKEEMFTAFGLELDQQTVDDLQEVVATNETQLQTLNQSVRGNSLSKLSFSDDEALALAELMHGQSWINEKATKTNFLKHARNATSIHLATHALMDTKNPNNSAIVFNKSHDSVHNLLRLDEIYNYDFNAKMITLSACNTGFGKYQKGEGLQSLARAFNFAKIPSVTATLWSIPDASSASIMKLYYTYLQQGFSKNVALQKAQIEYVENDEISSPASRLPFYWSAWTHIGDDALITFKQKNNTTHYFLIALAFIAFLGGFLWFKKTRG